MITKSPIDCRQYKKITLQNGLEVLLVSDEQTEKSAACLRVQIGSFQEPRDLPGLAHFLEHMLFLGTEEYPEENFLDNFLQQHGGTLNANTEDDATNYFFDVQQAALLEALPRFASLFVCPLLTESAVGREINQIESEFEMNVQADGWRLRQLFSHLTGDLSDFNRFCVGNRELLFDKPARNGINVYQRLREFHKRHYSAHLMTLCVVGREPLPSLEAAATAAFGRIERYPVEIAELNLYPPQKDAWGTETVAEAVKDDETMHFFWALPPVRSLFRTKPNLLLAHLVGHEGAGSLFAFLRDRGWALELTGGEFIENEKTLVFDVTIKLTAAGAQNRDRVAEALFAYLRMVRGADDAAWRALFGELAAVQSAAFRFKGKEPPGDYAIGLAHSLCLYRAEDLLTGPYLLTEPDVAAIRSFVGGLSAANFKLVFSSKRAAPGEALPRTEPIYGTRFAERKIGAELAARLEGAGGEFADAFSLPGRNRFVATDFEMKYAADFEADEVAPVLVHEEEGLQCYFNQTRRFNEPVGTVILHLSSPAVYSTPMNAILCRIFLKYVDITSQDALYDASVAGYTFHVAADKDALCVEISGFAQNLFAVFETALEQLDPARAIDENVFLSSKEAVVKELASLDVLAAHKKVSRDASRATEEPHWPDAVLRAIAKDVDVPLFAYFRKSLFSASLAKLYAAGNLTAAEAQHAARALSLFLRAAGARALCAAECPRSRKVRLPRRRRLAPLLCAETAHAAEPNSAALLVFQTGAADGAACALTRLLQFVAAEELYSELRVKEALGYYVAGFASEDRGVAEFRVLVQGEYAPRYLLGRIEAALSAIFEAAEKFSEKEFARYRTALVNAFLKREQNVKEEQRRFWREIKDGTVMFDRKQKMAIISGKITKEEFLRFFESKILDKNAARVMAFGIINPKTAKNMGTPDQSGFSPVYDVESFKRNRPLMAAVVTDFGEAEIGETE